MMFSCRKVVRMLSGAPPDAGAWASMAVWMHLTMCSHCRRFARQIEAIGEALRGTARHEADAGFEDRLKRRLRS